MNRKDYHSNRERGTTVGVDVGATLAKLAIERRELQPSFELLPADSPERVAERVEAEHPQRVGVTGPGATAVSRHLPLEAARIDEFSAWAAGARELLATGGTVPDDRYLLVSVGTGTSVLLIDGPRVTRVGGTALGGGTVLGLGTALVGSSSFQELCRLASRGSRQGVDLLISDIYPPDEIPLPGEVTASAFAKLARRDVGATPTPQDLARGVMQLVGENVGLICGGIAAACDVEGVVLGGCTLRENPELVGVLAAVLQAYGRKPTVLEQGEFAGAMGALGAARA